MNAMLEAQMLATALDVYFTDPALGGKRHRRARSARRRRHRPDEDQWHPRHDGGLRRRRQHVRHAAARLRGEPVERRRLRLVRHVKVMQGLAKDTFDAINNNRVFAP